MADEPNVLEKIGDFLSKGIMSGDKPNWPGVAITALLAGGGALLGGLGIIGAPMAMLATVVLGGIGLAAGSAMSGGNDSPTNLSAQPEKLTLGQINKSQEFGISNDLQRIALKVKNQPIPNALNNNAAKEVNYGALNTIENNIKLITAKAPDFQHSIDIKNTFDSKLQKMIDGNKVTINGETFGLQADIDVMTLNQRLTAQQFKSQTVATQARQIDQHLDDQIELSRQKLENNFGISKDFGDWQTYFNTITMVPGLAMNVTGSNPRTHMEKALKAFDAGDSTPFLQSSKAMVDLALPTKDSYKISHMHLGETITDAAEEMKKLHILVAKKQNLSEWIANTVQYGASQSQEYGSIYLAMQEINNPTGRTQPATADTSAIAADNSAEQKAQAEAAKAAAPIRDTVAPTPQSVAGATTSPTAGQPQAAPAQPSVPSAKFESSDVVQADEPKTPPPSNVSRVMTEVLSHIP